MECYGYGYRNGEMTVFSFFFLIEYENARPTFSFFLSYASVLIPSFGLRYTWFVVLGRGRADFIASFLFSLSKLHKHERGSGFFWYAMEKK